MMGSSSISFRSKRFCLICFAFVALFTAGAQDAHAAQAVHSAGITSATPSEFPAGKSSTVSVFIRSSNGSGNVILEADSWPSGWNVTPKNVNPTISQGTTYKYNFTVTTPSNSSAGTIVWKLYDDDWGTHPTGSKLLATKNQFVNTEPPTSIVAFDRQGGSGGSSSVTATYGSAMPSASAPSRTGYTFQGYYSSLWGGGTKYYNANMSSARNWDKTSYTTLYAYWTAKTYTVSLNKQSGSGGTSSVTATYGAAMPSASSPSRTGYTFQGYYTGTGGGGTKYYNSNMSSARTWNRTSSTTLYADWIVIKSTVTFNKQSGSGGTSSVTATYGSSMPSASAPSRTGYTFQGYYTGTGGGGTKYYNANMSSARTWNKTSNTTLYADWIVIKSTVTFNKQSGSGGSNSVTATYGYSMPSASAPSRTGYAFQGYYTETGSGGTKYYNANMSSARNWDKTSNTTLYADWNNPPTVIITSGPSGTINYDDVTFSWLGFDSDGTVGYEVEMDGIGSSTAYTTKTFNNLSSGSHTFRVRALDDDGAYSSWATRTFTIDMNKPPVIDSLTPSEGAIVSGTVQIIVGAYDPEDGRPTKIEYYIDNILRYTDMFPLAQSPTSTWDWDTTTYSDGLHEIKVIAWDKDNNSGTETVTVNVNSNLVKITNPTVGAQLTLNGADISWDYTGENDNVKIEYQSILDDNDDWTEIAIVPASQNQYIWDATGLPTGPYYKLRISDSTNSDISDSVDPFGLYTKDYGVTVITHGWTPGTNRPEWADNMASAIIERAGKGIAFEYLPETGEWSHLGNTYYYDGAKWNWDDDEHMPSNIDDGEVVLIFDWAAESAITAERLGEGFSEAAGDAMFASLKASIFTSCPSGLNYSGIDLFNENYSDIRPMHFIGHSRGNVVNSMAIRRIAEYMPDFTVEQVTLLDPHPVKYVDPGDRIYLWKSPNETETPIGWAVNYWRNGLGSADFVGEEVDGADNSGELDDDVLSGGYGLEHSDVHLFYLGTIDLTSNAAEADIDLITNDDQVFVPDNWYDDMGMTREKEGFYNSRLGGGGIPDNTQAELSKRTPVSDYPIATVFNGYFEYGGGGWSMHGGEILYVDPDANKLILGWGLEFAEKSTHNRFYMPKNAEQIVFNYQLDDYGQIHSPVTLDLSIDFYDIEDIQEENPIHLKTISFENEPGPWEEYPVEILIPDSIREIIGTLTFKVTTDPLDVSGQIKIGNIKILNKPDKPELYAPTDGASIGTLTPLFAWSEFASPGSMVGVAGYQLRVRSITDNEEIVYDTGYISDISVLNHLHGYSPGNYTGHDDITGVERVSQPLEWGKEYHWHVRYRDALGTWSDWAGEAAAERQDFTVGGVNVAPELSNGGVDPSDGYESTMFTYRVHYHDADGDIPSIVRVIINDVGHGMWLESGDAYNGTYIYETTSLPVGTHEYYFTAIDIAGGDDTTGTDSGPVVEQLLIPSIAKSKDSSDMGTTAQDTVFDVWNDGDLTLDYLVEVDQGAGYFSVSPGSGNSTGTFDRNTHTVYVDRSTIPAGQTVSGRIKISDPDADNSPEYISLSASKAGIYLTDINGDGNVDLQDYAIFSNHWLESFCEEPDWCGQADINHSGDVGMDDLTIMAEHWLENIGPYFNPIGNKSVEENSTLSFSIAAIDPDGDPITYSAAGTAITAGGVLTGQNFAWTPDSSQSGTYQVTFTATAGGQTDFETITITVNNIINTAPILASIGSKSGSEGLLIGFTTSASDSDVPANDLAFSLQGTPPTGASIDAVTGYFTWVPTEAQGPGTYNVTVRVTDDGTGNLYDEEVVAITVGEVNASPTLSTIGSKSVDEGYLLTFTASANDNDVPANTLSFSLINAPAGASIGSGTGVFAWTPSESHGSNSYNVTVRVTDNGTGSLYDEETISISVTETNTYPVLDPIGDKATNVGSQLTFTANATDTDVPANTLTYSLTTAPAGASIGSGTGVFTWTPSSGYEQTFNVTVRVTDDGAGTLFDEEAITITVGPDVTVPTLTNLSPADADVQVSIDSLIILTIADTGIGVDLATVTIDVDGNRIYDGGSETSDGIYDSTGDAQMIKGICRRTGTSAAYTFFFQADTWFDHEEHITVTVNASDLAATGNDMAEQSYSFYIVTREFGENAKVNSDTGTLVQDRPATAKDTAGNIWAVWDQTTIAGDTDVYIGKLAAGDSAFGESTQVTSDTNNQRNAVIAIDSSDKIYLAWQDYRQGKWDVYLTTSTDGETFSTETRITDPNSSQINPDIAIDSSDKVYIVWEDDQNSNNDIYIASSTDSFANKTTSQITSNASGQTSPAIAIDSARTVYVVWTDSRNASTDIYGATSASGPWTNVAIVNNANGQSYPAIATETSGTVLHLLWVDDTNGNNDIFYQTTTGGLGGLPFTGFDISDDTTSSDQYNPSIFTTGTTGSDLRVFACWEDSRNLWLSNDDTDIYYAETAIDGSAFRTNIMVNDDSGTSTQSIPVVNVDIDGNPYLAWVDSRGGNKDIYYVGAMSIGSSLVISPLITASTGGIVEIDDTTNNVDGAGDVRVVIPSGALPVDASITISEMINPPSPPAGGFGVNYEFGPSGLEFNSPVTILLPHAAADCPGHAIYRAYWYNLELSAWYPPGGIEAQHGVDQVSGVHYITFETDHFTGFGIGGSSSGGGFNIADLIRLADKWLWTGAPGSIEEDIAPLPDGDGKVDLLDFSLMAENWME